MRAKALIAVALGAVAVAGVGVAVRVARAPAFDAARALEAVTIAANVNYVGSCPVLAAHERGYFLSEGLAVTIQPHGSGKLALDAAIDGRADLATAAETPIVFAVLRGSPVAIVATIFRAERDHGVVARSDRGIARPADLAGKRVGVTLGTSGHFFLDAFLNRQLLRAGAAAVVDLKPQDLPPALARGEVDAISTWEPHVAAAVTLLGAGGVLLQAEGIYELAFNLAGSRAVVAARPQAMQAMQAVLRAALRGARYCQDSPDEAVSVFARAGATALVPQRAAWPSYRFRLTLDQALVLSLEDQARWALRSRLAADGAGVPNFLDHIDADALRAVRSAAVTIAF